LLDRLRSDAAATLPGADRTGTRRQELTRWRHRNGLRQVFRVIATSGRTNLLNR